MANITPLVISYPDFILGQIIDPEEFDQNNTEIVEKVNEIVNVTNENTNIVLPEIDTKADNAVATAERAEIKAGNAVTTANMAITRADNAVATANNAETKVDGLAGVDRTTETVKGNADNLATHLADGTQHVKLSKFVIGTSTSGWTSADCDYLCDGTADDVEINAAIIALPATGGEIVILDGTYNITAKIDINKSNVSIKGNGNATILKRMWNSTDVEGVIALKSVMGCKIEKLQIDGNRATYQEVLNYGIYSYSSNNNTITGNISNNNSYYGINTYSSNNNTITGNICNNNLIGIYLSNSNKNNTITSNTCNNNSDYGICLSYNNNNNNNITSNTCNNNSGYGICLSSNSTTYPNKNNNITSNTCNNNSDYGICLSSNNNNNNITGNTCIRGNGTPEDYTVSQYTIRLYDSNVNNLISSNNCMGKAVVIDGGTSNTEINNKWE